MSEHGKQVRCKVEHERRFSISTSKHIYNFVYYRRIDNNVFMIFGFCLQIHIVHNTNSNKPRGYAFIEYEHERDMHGMYPKIFKSKT